MLAAVDRYRGMAEAELARQGSPVPVELVLATIEAESQGNPNAYRAEVKINDASRGLMQILLRTAQGEGYQGDGDGLFDPETNIRYGVSFQTSLWQQLGNAAAVASAYNGGYRPKLGFGAPYHGEPYDTVVARDTRTGQPIRTRTVQPGEYANQPYVNKVMRLFQSYTRAQGLPPVIIDGSDGSRGFADPGLLWIVLGAGVLTFLLVRR